MATGNFNSSSPMGASAPSSTSSVMFRSCSLLLALVICCLAMSARAQAAPAFSEFRGVSPFQLGPQRDERYNSLIEALMMQGGLGRGRGGAAGFIDGGSPSKRQLRYHQCYFNPVSCFRRK